MSLLPYVGGHSQLLCISLSSVCLICINKQTHTHTPRRHTHVDPILPALCHSACPGVFAVVLCSVCCAGPLAICNNKGHLPPYAAPPPALHFVGPVGLSSLCFWVMVLAIWFLQLTHLRLSGQHLEMARYFPRNGKHGHGTKFYPLKVGWKLY